MLFLYKTASNAGHDTHHPVCHGVGWYCNEIAQEIRFDIEISESVEAYINCA